MKENTENVEVLIKNKDAEEPNFDDEYLKKRNILPINDDINMDLLELYLKENDFLHNLVCIEDSKLS